ncbi:MAG TPA: hypothetical protein PK867_14600, partial [Pirellulales bacterium]|nr:hypothetical protein [Pirellulales bacterium]
AVSEVELPAYAYISLTEIHGTARLRLELTDLSDGDGEPQAEFEITVTGADPLDIIELVVPFAPLPTPHAGYYSLELSNQEGPRLELLGSHRSEAIIAEGEDQ